MTNKLIHKTIMIIFGLCMLLIINNTAFAHCDSYDGPVIKDAIHALDQKDVTPVLKWVTPEDETSIRSLFDQILAVRGKGEDIRKIVDTYFFESLVRIHRASEGEGFTGLKPAGTVSPAIAGADKSLQTGNIDHFADKIASAVREEIKKRFIEAYEKKKTADQSINQGREYVKSYVNFTHFVEGIHQIVSHGPHHSHREKEVTP